MRDDTDDCLAILLVDGRPDVRAVVASVPDMAKIQPKASRDVAGM